MVFDCFLFHDEFETLEIRLAELGGLVDCVVLAEASETHSGNPKQLAFQEASANLFRHPKGGFLIQGVQVYPYAIPPFPPGSTARQREEFARNSLANALACLGATADDHVLLSDADEVPNREALQFAIDRLETDPSQCFVFEQTVYYYHLNCRSSEQWLGTRCANWGNIKSLATFRHQGGTVLPRAGWHFSYLGGANRVLNKIRSSIHTELNLPEIANLDHINRCLDSASDLFGRSFEYEVVHIDDSFPAHIRDNQERFEHLIRPVIITPNVNASLLGATNPLTSPSQGNVFHIRELYARAISEPSDINEHLSYLTRLASTVNHVTEFGTRSGVSTAAFLHALPEKLICYDIVRHDHVDELEVAASGGHVSFHFITGDVLDLEIEPTDLLFIDTWHTGSQMAAELGRHAAKVRRYLVMHDTETFAYRGEDGSSDGIWPAISAFMRSSTDWRLMAHFSHNNGLSVFERVLPDCRF